jgi:hypothetical protein
LFVSYSKTQKDLNKKKMNDEKCEKGLKRKGKDG